jgi:uncharacterized membrane protein
VFASLLDALSEAGRWLNGTEAHLWARHLLRGQNWISPAVQSVHILSVAAVIGSIGLIDLRVMGLAARSQPIPEMARRLLPWMWTALVLLLATGGLLILNRPARYFDNPAFVAKMAMLALALILTLMLRPGLLRNGGRAGPMRALAAALSLLLWFGIIFAGRWIAYV